MWCFSWNLPLNVTLNIFYRIESSLVSYGSHAIYALTLYTDFSHTGTETELSVCPQTAMSDHSQAAVPVCAKATV